MRSTHHFHTKAKQVKENSQTNKHPEHYAQNAHVSKDGFKKSESLSKGPCSDGGGTPCIAMRIANGIVNVRDGDVTRIIVRVATGNYGAAVDITRKFNSWNIDKTSHRASVAAHLYPFVDAFRMENVVARQACHLLALLVFDQANATPIFAVFGANLPQSNSPKQPLPSDDTRQQCWRIHHGHGVNSNLTTDLEKDDGGEACENNVGGNDPNKQRREDVLVERPNKHRSWLLEQQPQATKAPNNERQSRNWERQCKTHALIRLHVHAQTLPADMRRNNH